MNTERATKAHRMDAIIIACVPIVIGIVVVFLTNKVEFTMCASVGHDLIVTIVGVLGTLLGFVITAISILLTLGDNRFIDLLKKANHMQNVILSYIMASVYLLAALIYSVVILFTQSWNKTIFLVLVGANSTAAISMVARVFFLFMIVLQTHKHRINGAE